MPTKDERLFIDTAEWGLHVGCGCNDPACRRVIAVEYPDVRSLGERLIGYAQQYEQAQEAKRELEAKWLAETDETRADANWRPGQE